jgi:anti-sigma B factor antagonist
MSNTTSRLRIEERYVGDVTVLTLTGEITLHDGETALGRRVDDLVNGQGRTRILVDLAGVGYIDSAGVGTLTAALKLVRSKGGAFKLLHLQGRAQRQLAMMNLTPMFEIFEDEAPAIGSFAPR